MKTDGSAAPAEPSDLDLVQRIKSGQEDAFEQMVDRYHARVYSLSYGVLRNAEDAEEMSTSDIAETLEISIPALKSRLHRARLYVRQRLAEISQAPAQEEVSR